MTRWGSLTQSGSMGASATQKKGSGGCTRNTKSVIRAGPRFWIVAVMRVKRGVAGLGLEN